MDKTGTNFQLTSVGPIAGFKDAGRVEMKENLHLTGAEISINTYGPNEFTPYTHAHKLNEEIYFVMKGDGFFKVDGDEFAVSEGDVIRVDPAGNRAIKAGNDGITYMCIQAQQNSLTQITAEDGILVEDDQASWMQ